VSNIIYQNIVTGNEESLEAKLATGSKNPVGVIAILNRRHGWNSPYTSNGNTKSTALPVSELPKLNVNQAQLEEKQGEDGA
jgi:hypothetical protein